MALRSPDAREVLIILVPTAIYIGLTAWGWGSWSGLIAHPARLGACLMVALASLTALFSGANLGNLASKDARTPLVILLAIGFGLVQAWLPAYADRRDLATLDGDATRYKEESMLRAEFGEDYTAYTMRTWRLLPCIC